MQQYTIKTKTLKSTKKLINIYKKLWFSYFLLLIVHISHSFCHNFLYFTESVQRLGLALDGLKVDKKKMVLNFGQQTCRPKPPSRHKQDPDTSHNV